jgi:hypothetical protein
MIRSYLCFQAIKAGLLDSEVGDDGRVTSGINELLFLPVGSM